jgi:hypothetical protein
VVRGYKNAILPIAFFKNKTENEKKSSESRNTEVKAKLYLLLMMFSPQKLSWKV